MAYSKLYKEKLAELDKDLSLNDLLELTQELHKEGIFSELITQSLIEEIDIKQSRLAEIMAELENWMKQKIAESLRFYLVYRNKKKK